MTVKILLKARKGDRVPGSKYIRREDAPGGGYRYIYKEADAQHPMVAEPAAKKTSKVKAVEPEPSKGKSKKQEPVAPKKAAKKPEPAKKKAAYPAGKGKTSPIPGAYAPLNKVRAYYGKLQEDLLAQGASPRTVGWIDGYIDTLRFIRPSQTKVQRWTEEVDALRQLVYTYGQESGAAERLALLAEDLPWDFASRDKEGMYSTSIKQVKTGSVESPFGQITSSEDVAGLLEQYKDEAKEKYHVVCLDEKGKVLNVAVTSVGSLSSAIAHPLQVSQVAITTPGCKQIWTSHNHPSGVSTPSKEDIQVHERMISALDTVGITVAGHVVLGYEDYTFIDTKYHETRPYPTPAAGKKAKKISSVDVVQERTKGDMVQVSGPDSIANLIGDLVSGDSPCIAALALDAKNRIIGIKMITKGGKSATQDILKFTMQRNAASFVIGAHNMPERALGEAFPGLGEASKVAGIELLDAVITERSGTSPNLFYTSIRSRDGDGGQRKFFKSLGVLLLLRKSNSPETQEMPQVAMRPGSKNDPSTSSGPFYVARYTPAPEADIKRDWSAWSGGRYPTLFDAALALLPYSIDQLAEKVLNGQNEEDALTALIKEHQVDLRWDSNAEQWAHVHHDGLSCWALDAETVDEARREATKKHRSKDIGPMGFGYRTVGKVRMVGKVLDGLYIFSTEEIQPESPQ